MSSYLTYMISKSLSTLSPISATIKNRRQFVAKNGDCRRKVRLSPFSRRFRRQSPFSATVALFLRQSPFSVTVWTGLNSLFPAAELTA